MWQLGDDNTGASTNPSGTVLINKNANGSILPVAQSNIFQVTDNEKQFFFGQLANLSNIDGQVSIHRWDEAKVHQHDLRAKESITLNAFPISQLQYFAPNGTWEAHGMGVIVECDNDQDVAELLLQTEMYENLVSGRVYNFPICTRTTITTATTTTIKTPATGFKTRVYKITVACDGADRVDIEWTDSDGTSNANFIGKIRFGAEGTFVYDFGDQGYECPNGLNGLMRAITSTTANCVIDVISQDVDFQ